MRVIFHVTTKSEKVISGQRMNAKHNNYSLMILTYMISEIRLMYAYNNEQREHSHYAVLIICY